MRGKMGSAHFEMIIGFVFFIGFVVFLFMFLSPWDNSSLSNSAIEGLHVAFERETSTQLSSVFVKTNYAGGASCFYIDLPDEIFKYAITDKSSLVTRLGGVDIDSGLFSDGSLNLEKDDNFFRVAISPEFTDEGVSSCEILNDFELGGVVEMEVVSYSKLVEMNQSYYNNYGELKQNLKLAEIFDFAIVPEGLPEVRMEPVDSVPNGVEVLAKEYVVKVLRSDGAISNERISFRIW